MKYIITSDYDEMSRKAAELIADYIERYPEAKISLATGSTVVSIYERLAELVKERGIFGKGLRCFNMDEYVSLSRDNTNGFYYFLIEHIYKKLGVPRNQIFGPNACANDLEKACEDYSAKIESAGGLDFILLGIGTDGHIAFNMPKTVLQAETHIEDLSDETRAANARFFDRAEDVPRQAITIGVGTILRSKKIVLVANGKSKSAAIAKMSERIIDPLLPASLLWLHNDVICILDEDAAEGLRP